MQGIAKWPEKGYAGHSQMARRVSQSIGKWPKSYAGHRKMGRKGHARHSQMARKGHAWHSQMARKGHAWHSQMARKAMQGIRWLLVGIGEMKQNIDEMAKKTDAICTWVFGAMQVIHVQWHRSNEAKHR
jgi:hypothetical protein